MNHRPLLSPPKPLGRRLLQPFTHTNKNKSRCRPLNSAKASFPLAPRAARSCARGLGTLPADLALSLPAHPVSFSHRAARRAEWDVTAGTGVACSCQEWAGYSLRKPPGQMPHTRVLPPAPPPPSPPCPSAGGVGELPASAVLLRLPAWTGTSPGVGEPYRGAGGGPLLPLALACIGLSSPIGGHVVLPPPLPASWGPSTSFATAQGTCRFVLGLCVGRRGPSPSPHGRWSLVELSRAWCLPGTSISSRTPKPGVGKPHLPPSSR